MQAAGMLCGTRAISLLVLMVPPLISYVYSSPLQYLPSIPGYIPVYIRYGDEPLDQINPDLAEAFGETSNSVKSLQKIDHTLAHESDNFKDDDINVFLEESSKKHAYPLHVREAEPSFATVSSADPNKPKLLNIYELPDDNETRPRRRFRGRSKMKNLKPPLRKIDLLSDTEKEELEKLAIEVEKEETKPNELYGSHPRSPHHRRNERPYNRQNAHDFVGPIKGENPLRGSLIDLSGMSKVADFSNDYNIAETDKIGSPVKEQGPDTVLSNVNKLLPIDFPDESKIDEDTIPKVEKLLPNKQADQSEIPQVKDLSKPSEDHDFATSEDDENESPIKIQHPTSILSNVDKLSPIDLPDESKTAEHNKNDSTEPNDEIATD